MANNLQKDPSNYQTRSIDGSGIYTWNSQSASTSFVPDVNHKTQLIDELSKELDRIDWQKPRDLESLLSQARIYVYSNVDAIDPLSLKPVAIDAVLSLMLYILQTRKTVD